MRHKLQSSAPACRKDLYKALVFSSVKWADFTGLEILARKARLMNGPALQGTLSQLAFAREGTGRV